MSVFFPDPSTLYVTNSTTSDQTDINLFVNATSDGFDAVETRIVNLETGQSKANLWSREERGVLVEDIIGGVTVQDYSSSAYAGESKGWALAGATGEPTHYKADGTVLTKGAKAYSEDADASAQAALASENKAEDWAVGVGEVEPGKLSAEAYADLAADSATTAIGTNEILAGSNITVVKSPDPAPHTYTVSTPNSVQDSRTISAGSGLTGGGNLTANRTLSHADTSSQGSVNNSGATVIQDVTLDTYGHTTGLASKTLSYTDVGAAATSHSHSYLPLSGGTVTGITTFSASNLYCGGVLQMSGVNSPINFTNTSSATVNYMTDADYGSIIWKSNTQVLVFGNTSYGPVSVQGSTADMYATSKIQWALPQWGFQMTKDIYYSLNTFSDNQADLGNPTQRWGNLYYAGALLTSSDRDLKKNIQDLDDASFIYGLRPRTYEWKHEKDNDTHMGFIAQEMEAVVSNEAVVQKKSKVKMKNKDGVEEERDIYMGLAPLELLAPMVKCIQEQKAKIDELEARIVALEG